MLAFKHQEQSCQILILQRYPAGKDTISAFMIAAPVRVTDYYTASPTPAINCSSIRDIVHLSWVQI